MNPIVIRIDLKNDDVYAFNFEYVRDFNYNEKSKTVKITTKGSDKNWTTKTFFEVDRLTIEKLENIS